MCVWPFLFVRPGISMTQLSGMFNHEHIHARQQLEMFWLFFFLWYGIEYLVRLVYHKDHHNAYRSISFEREAFTCEHDLLYLKSRKTYAWVKYL